MPFVHLHCHDSFSLLDGAMSTKAMVAKAKAMGQTAIAQTNHGNMFGTLQFYKECKKQGIKPIIGLEAYIAPFSRKKYEKEICPVTGKELPAAWHLTLLAMNEQGMKNLFKLSSTAYADGFYYKPRIDEELLQQYNEGIICLSGCLKGKIQQYLLAGHFETALAAAKTYQEIFGDRLYIEVQRVIAEQDTLVPWQETIAKRLGLKCVATCDAHYVTATDADFHEQLQNLKSSNGGLGRMENLYLKTEDEMNRLFRDHPDFVQNTIEVAGRCDVVLPEKYDYLFPTFSADDIAELRRQAWAGLGERKLAGSIEHQERLEYELKVITQMGFASYFLIVSDYIHWARNNGIAIGPGRGSAAGSLVSYCLGITNVEPMKYGLMFQRFLNSGRKSMPDIDVDVCKQRRGELIEYLYEKYGRDRVAQMATFAEFKPRGAIRDFARAQGQPYTVGEQASKLVPPASRGHEPTWEEVKTAAPELWKGDYAPICMMAEKTDGMVRGDGVHAAGMVISNRPLVEDIPLFKGRDGQVVTQWDMGDVEAVGLVKMDILGLMTLSVISICLRLIKETEGKDVDLNKIPDDDPDTYKLIRAGDTNGLFQLDAGGGIRDLCMKLQPNNIEDLAAINAIFRPGPLDGGVAGHYVRRKRLEEPVTYTVPQLKNILEPTLGYMIYQEQVMRIAQELAGYTLEEADDLRKAIGKKLREKMAKEEEHLISGMQKHGIAETAARQIWEDIKQFADYGFNKSHAIAYSVLTYQTGYLKAHYPLQYYCALLSMHMKERDRSMSYLADCKTKDLQVLPPDVNESAIDFTISRGTIRFGLAAIKDMGEKASAAVLEARKAGPFKDIFDFYQRTSELGVNKKTLEALAKAGAFDSLNLSRAAAIQMVEPLVEYGKQIKQYRKKLEAHAKKVEKYEEKLSLIQGTKRKTPKAPELPTEPSRPDVPVIAEIQLDEKLVLEKEMLGLYVTSHPLYNYSNELLTRTSAHTASLTDHHGGEVISILGLISSVRHIDTKRGTKMAVIDLEDLNGHVDVTVFSKLYNKYKDNLVEGKVVLLSAKVEEVDENSRRLIADQMEFLAKKTGSQPQRVEIYLRQPDDPVARKISAIVNDYPGHYEVNITIEISRKKYRLIEAAKLSLDGIKLLSNIQSALKGEISDG